VQSDFCVTQRTEKHSFTTAATQNAILNPMKVDSSTSAFQWEQQCVNQVKTYHWDLSNEAIKIKFCIKLNLPLFLSNYTLKQPKTQSASF